MLIKKSATRRALSAGEASRTFVENQPERWYKMDHNQMIETSDALNMEGEDWENARTFIYKQATRWDQMNADQMQVTARLLGEAPRSRAFIENHSARWDQMDAAQMTMTDEALYAGEASLNFCRKPCRALG